MNDKTTLTDAERKWDEGQAVGRTVAELTARLAAVEAERDEAKSEAFMLNDRYHTLLSQYVAADQRMADLRASITGVVPTAEDFAAQRRHIRAVYTSATDSGYLLGTINAVEELADKVRALLDNPTTAEGER